MPHEIDQDQGPLLEVAYFVEPYWHNGEWIKNLLLYFDGVAVLVPDYMRDRPLDADPFLALPLAEQGLLHRLSPETLVDQSTTDALVSLVDDLLIQTGMVDSLKPGEFAELSLSRLGGHIEPELVEIVLEELRDRGLARASADGVSVPLHPAIRTLILVALPQLLRTPAEAAGYSLQPITRNERVAHGLRGLLQLGHLPEAGTVVGLDLESVALDLTAVPLDELLDFRREHGSEYREYARGVRTFIRSLQGLDERHIEQALKDRQEEIADTLALLTRQTRSAWGIGAGAVLLGAIGSALPAGPLAAAAGGVQELFGLHRSADSGSAYSYLIQASDYLSAR